MKYYDIREQSWRHEAICVIIGGRGIGKTYSAAKFLLEEKKPFLYLRNTQTQMDECATAFGNPFKRISLDMDRDVRLVAEKKHYLVYDYTNPERELIGYGAALSTFSNLRGVDLSDVRYVLFDEFIERRTLSFNQFDAFQQMYETINRNRELQGEEPLRCYLLSNSQTLRNDILLGYGLVDRIQKMIAAGEKIYREPGLYVELPTADISELKKETANYKLISGSNAAREALENEFTYDSYKNVGKRPLQEYLPLCYAEIPGAAVYFYKHKSSPQFYAAQVPNMSGRMYDQDKYNLFLREFGLLLRSAAIRGKVFYESYEVKLMCMNLLRLT